MTSSIRVYVSPIAAVVTLAIGIGFVAAIRAVSAMFRTPNAVTRSVPVDPKNYYDFNSAPRVETPPTPDGPTEFSCFDPHLLPIWTELKKDGEFKDRVGENAGPLSCSDLLEVKSGDLNRDGHDGVLVRGKDFQMCSAVGNCGFWIFEKRGGRARILLSSSDYNGGYDQLGAQVQKSRTRGYSNILLKGHFTAADTSYTTYAFNGRRYVESRCMYEVPKYGREGEGSMEMITCEEFYRRQEAETAAMNDDK